MLSPLRPSAPSTSLLQFLRCQTGVATGTSACVRPKPRVLCHDNIATGSSRRSTGWARPSGLESFVTLEAGLSGISGLSSRPAVSTCSSHQVIPVRYSSTNRRPLLRRLFDLKRGKSADYKHNRNVGPALIDEGTEGMFNIGRGLAAKASNELRIRCTEFDMNGNVTLVNGEFRKSELIAKVRHLPCVFGR